MSDLFHRKNLPVSFFTSDRHMVLFQIRHIVLSPVRGFLLHFVWVRVRKASLQRLEILSEVPFTRIGLKAKGDLLGAGRVAETGQLHYEKCASVHSL